jgi:hypothetical protein
MSRICSSTAPPSEMRCRSASPDGVLPRTFQAAAPDQALNSSLVAHIASRASAGSWHAQADGMVAASDNRV